MPRPALSLYQQLPIVYKHRSLLLSTLGSTTANIDIALPQITSGFTGLVCSLEQLINLPSVQRSYLPKVVQLNSSESPELIGNIAEVHQMGASAILMNVELGLPTSEAQLQNLQVVVTKAKKYKLVTIVRFTFKQQLTGNTAVIMKAYALRTSVDYKVNFLLTEPHAIADFLTMFQIADQDTILVQSKMLPSAELKRLLATGVKGIVVNLEDLLTGTDPGQTAHNLGEAVFGPGSYKPTLA